MCPQEPLVRWWKRGEPSSGSGAGHEGWVGQAPAGLGSRGRAGYLRVGWGEVQSISKQAEPRPVLCQVCWAGGQQGAGNGGLCGKAETALGRGGIQASAGERSCGVGVFAARGNSGVEWASTETPRKSPESRETWWSWGVWWDDRSQDPRKGRLQFGPSHLLFAAFPGAGEEGKGGRNEGAALGWGWGPLMLFGILSARSLPPRLSVQLLRPSPDPSSPRGGSGCGSRCGSPRRVPGEGVEGRGKTGVSSAAPRPPSRPAPSLSPLPAPGRRSARSPRARALATPAASSGPALRRRLATHPCARQPRGPRRRARAPSSAAAGRGRVLDPPCRESSGSWCWCSGRLPGR